MRIFDFLSICIVKVKANVLYSKLKKLFLKAKFKFSYISNLSITNTSSMFSVHLLTLFALIVSQYCVIPVGNMSVGS